MFFFQTQLLAQSVSGTIKDQEGKGIEDVLIQVEGSTTATLSDKNGIFKLKNLFEGTQILQIHQIGFATRTDTLNF